MISGMIGRLTGEFGGTTPDGSALIDVSGVGYTVRTPSLTLAALSETVGSRVSLYIHTAVREDAIDLYGFPSEEELAFFKQLMSVSGVGPKTALGIMSVAEVSSLKRAIAQSDSVTLIKVFGIGKKSAERLVVELRDKIKLEVPAAGAGPRAEDDSDVIEALMALGYRADESRRILKEIPPTTRGTRERLSAALRFLGTQSVS